MAVSSNGRAKKPKKSTANGSVNGDLNGHVNGHLNGHADKPKASTISKTSSTKQQRPKSTMSGTLISIVSRLLVWYAIITAIFRCPSSLSQLSDSSPQICKPYLQGRSIAAPYVDPYYQKYVAPRVDRAKPYVHKLERTIYTPSVEFAKTTYNTHGADRFNSAQQYSQAAWDKNIQPHVRNAEVQIKEQYAQHVAPRVQAASTNLNPLYLKAKDSVVEIYHLSILPAYEAVLPHAHKAYAQGNYIVVHTIFPTVRSAQVAVWKLVSRTLWPQARVLYGNNVEPQLVRIGERLGRYKDQQKVESVVDAVESEQTTAAESTASVPTIAASTTTKSRSGWGVLDDFFGKEASTSTVTAATEETFEPSAKPEISEEELRERLNEDLRNWQTKFAVAADKGAEDLEARVDEITKRQIERGVRGHGKALLVQLEESAASVVPSFKSFIKNTVSSVPGDPTQEQLEAAYEQCVTQTRDLGLVVKQKAQAVRDWKSAYDQETDTLVQAAVSSTLEVLDKIHGLGLQEVGMRWAWTDGVTYNDWQNYHKLRTTLTEWQAEVEQVGSRHDGLKAAHAEAASLEDQAMSASATAVNEIVRLKDVAKWKLWADDATDDFSDRTVPPRVLKAAKGAVQSAKDLPSQASAAIMGSETPLTQSLASVAKESASSVSSLISAATQGSDDLGTKLSSEASKASSKASQAGESGASSAATIASVAQASAKKVWGGAMAESVPPARQPVFEEPIDDDESGSYQQALEDLLSKADARAADVTRAMREALLGGTSTAGNVEYATSFVGDRYQSAVDAASRALYGTQPGQVEIATSAASERLAQAMTAASYAIFGTPTPTAVVKTVQTQLTSRYDEAVSLANEQYTVARSQVSLLVSGTPKPAHESLLAMIENVYSDSLAAASEKLQAALQYTETVKSYAAGPTQGYFESVSSIASARLAEGLDFATAQLSAQPTPALEGARRQYYEAIGLAHARYSDFLGAASSAVYGPEQGSFESYAAAASMSAASIAAYASSAVVGTSTPWAQSVASAVSGSAVAAAQDASVSAVSAASKASVAAEYAASQVSSNVIGTETPWTESIASRASQNWDAIIAQASSQVYGAPTPWPNSVYNQAGAYAAQATAQAAVQYASVQALISELVVGKEPDFTESVMDRFSSAYYSGIPAAVSSVNSYASANYEAASAYAGESYEAVTDYAADAYASASSVVSSVFTPPPAIESILASANEQLSVALESASAAVYGTSKGTVEQAGESVASAYSSVQSQASVAIYGTQQAQDSFLAVANSAQLAISSAIFGTPTAAGYASAVTSGAADAYSSVSSVAAEKAANAASAISSAIYGPEQGAAESASSRLASAVEAANSRISELYVAASKNANAAAGQASTAAAAATQKIKDEL